MDHCLRLAIVDLVPLKADTEYWNGSVGEELKCTVDQITIDLGAHDQHDV